MEDYRQEIGVRLKQVRKNKHFTQEQIAEALDISQKHYSEAERGLTGLSVGHLIEFSELLSVSLDYLLKGNTSQDTATLIPPSPIDSLYNDSSEYMKQQMLRVFQIMKEIESHSSNLRLSKLPPKR